MGDSPSPRYREPETFHNERMVDEERFHVVERPIKSVYGRLHQSSPRISSAFHVRGYDAPRQKIHSRAA